jgi:hypothetical protein
VGVGVGNRSQYVECPDHEDEDGPELRDVSTDEAEDGHTEEDESQYDGERRMVEGTGDAGEEDHRSGAFLWVPGTSAVS